MISATARLVLAVASIFSAASLGQPTTATRRSDANGNPIRTARTGHVSNYDESKVGAYTLPDPLVMADGRPVRDTDTWFRLRRPEILKLYETEIYGRVPPNAPRLAWDIVAADPALNGSARLTELTSHVPDRPDGPKITLKLYVPAKATQPVPVILCLNFGLPRPATRTATPPPPTTAPTTRRLGGDPIADILAHGWAYATVIYTDIQPDNAAGLSSGVIGLTLAPGQTRPEPDEWGAISAWAWGISRVVDYFESNPALDAKRVAIMGHSRLGKTVLWAGAQDPRIAVVFSSCSGEMGASLARRDWGETVDDMAQNFPYQFCGNFQKYAGRWNDMPVDAHMLIALNAPHAVFVTGGTGDQWADPKGEFLAELAAGPVYRLLGKKDLAASQLPPLDVPLIEGDLGWHYHTGGHMATSADWKAFLDFADRHLK
jgi:hypothetical protein